MEAKVADQLEKEQIVEEFAKTTTEIEEKSTTTDLKDWSPIAKEESKDSGVDTRPDESVILEESGLPVYSSVKVIF